MSKCGTSICPRHPPKPPRRPPHTAPAEALRNGVEAAGAAGAAVEDAEEREEAAGPGAMPGNRLIAIFRTGRQVPAAMADEAGERELIEADEAHAEKAAGRAAKGPLPVPACAAIRAGAFGSVTHADAPGGTSFGLSH